MQITTVSVRVGDTGEAAGFFEDVLLLAVDRKPDSVDVRIGTTLLSLT